MSETVEVKVVCDDASHNGKTITLYRLPILERDEMIKNPGDWQLVIVPLVGNRQLVDNPRTTNDPGARYAAVLMCDRCSRKVEYRKAKDLYDEITRRGVAGIRRVSLAELDGARQRATGR